MNEAERQRQLKHIAEALDVAERDHSPEELARAAHELEQEIRPASAAQGLLRLEIPNERAA